MVPPAGSRTVQGYELQLGTNCLGSFLVTRLLQPLLVETAKVAPTGQREGRLGLFELGGTVFSPGRSGYGEFGL